MDKQLILESIVRQFASIGIAYTAGDGADLTVNAEFMDAGFSTGNKRITYEASVFLDESIKTAFMWEKSTETGQGFSFGSDSESTFQSGMTLFRKVKSVRYAPDGKAYEYTLDLGSITKAVKEAARSQGWKFKTVLTRSKAQYPAGYIPSGLPAAPESAAGYCGNCGMPLAQGSRFCAKCGKPVDQSETASAPFADPNSKLYAQPAGKPQKSGGKRAFNNVGLALFAVILLALCLLAEVSIPGIVILAVLLLTLFILSNILIRKGCLPVILIWLLFIALIFFVLIYTMDKPAAETGSPGLGVSVSGSGKTDTVSSPNEDIDSGSPAGAFEVGAANTRGNTNGNIINDGYAAIQDNYIFIAANSTLYRMKTDGSDLTRLTENYDFYAHDLNLLGEWLYYIDGNGQIARTSLITGNLEVIQEISNVDNLIATQDKLYFISGSAPYSFTLADNTLTQLSDSYCQSLNLTGNYIYYQDNMSYTTAVKVKTDGSEKTVFTPDLLSYSMYLVSEGNVIYYSDNNSRNFYKVSDDGTGKALVCSDQTLLLNVSGDYIYYANELDGNKAYRVKTDGSEKQKLCDVAAKKISVVGDFAVITADENSQEVTYVVGTDGSNLFKLE